MSENEELQKSRNGDSAKQPVAPAAPSSGGGHGNVLALQRSVGNAATGQLLGAGGGTGLIQRKPTATPPAPPAPTGSGGPSTSTTTEYDQTGKKTTTSETTRGTKAKTVTDESSDVFDGTTTKTSSVKEETFAGAGTVVKVIKSSTPEEITHAVEALAQAGLFGESTRKAAIQRGSFSAKAEGSAKGMIGASASGKASVTISDDLRNAIKAMVEATAKVGIGGDLEGSLELAFGKDVALSLKGQLHAFAGAMASVKGTADIGIDHVYLEGEARAMAGAEASGKGEATLKLGDAEATAAIEGSAFAGAEAAAGGKFKIDLSGVELSGKVEAFAGVKASASGKASVGYKGKQIFSAKGEVGVSAGVGGKAEGAFEFRGGKLKIKGNLAGALGIGGELGFEVEVDFVVLAQAIEDLIVRAFTSKADLINRESPKVPRIPIIDEALAAKKEQQGYNAYVKDFLAYDAKKAKTGDSGIKRERVQEILDNRWNTFTEEWQFVEFDKGVTRAAKEAFGSKLTDVIIQCGQLRAFEVQRTPAQKEHLKKQRAKQGLKF